MFFLESQGRSRLALSKAGYKNGKSTLQTYVKSRRLKKIAKVFAFKYLAKDFDYQEEYAANIFNNGSKLDKMSIYLLMTIMTGRFGPIIESMRQYNRRKNIPKPYLYKSDMSSFHKYNKICDHNYSGVIEVVRELYKSSSNFVDKSFDSEACTKAFMRVISNVNGFHGYITINRFGEFLVKVEEDWAATGIAIEEFTQFKKMANFCLNCIIRGMILLSK